MWRRFINWLFRPDPVEVRITFDPLPPQEIVVRVVVAYPEPTSGAIAVTEPESAPDTGEPEPEPPTFPQVRPFTVHPIEQPPTVDEAIEEVVKAVEVSNPGRGALRSQMVRGFGARAL